MEKKERYIYLNKKSLKDRSKEDNEELYNLFFELYNHCPKCFDPYIKIVERKMFPYNPKMENFDCSSCWYRGLAIELLDASMAKQLKEMENKKQKKLY